MGGGGTLVSVFGTFGLLLWGARAIGQSRIQKYGVYVRGDVMPGWFGALPPPAGLLAAVFLVFAEPCASALLEDRVAVEAIYSYSRTRGLGTCSACQSRLWQLLSNMAEQFFHTL